MCDEQSEWYCKVFSDFLKGASKCSLTENNNCFPLFQRTTRNLASNLTFSVTCDEACFFYNGFFFTSPSPFLREKNDRLIAGCIYSRK